MPRISNELRLEKAQKAADAAKARLRSARAKVAAASRTESRKKDTRRKILLGAWLIRSAETNPKTAASVEKFIASLTEERDKEAFAGWQLPSPAQNTPKSAPPVSGAFEEKAASADAASRASGPASAQQKA